MTKSPRVLNSRATDRIMKENKKYQFRAPSFMYNNLPLNVLSTVSKISVYIQLRIVEHQTLSSKLILILFYQSIHYIYKFIYELIYMQLYCIYYILIYAFIYKAKTKFVGMLSSDSPARGYSDRRLRSFGILHLASLFMPYLDVMQRKKEIYQMPSEGANL